MGPMGEATAASHVLTLANNKVSATALMNYAGRGGDNSTLSYVNVTLGETEGGKLLGGSDIE